MALVWLVGMPGAGKTTVGKSLARLLETEFVDTDAELERRADMEVREVFEAAGEPIFRRIESEIVAEFARRDGLVVSVGGGAVMDRANRDRMKASGTVVLLDVPLEVLALRVGDGDERPLLREPEDLRRLAEARDREYREAADAVVDATAPPDEVARRVLEVLP